MGNVAGYRAAWIQAEAYRRKWDKWNADHKGDPPHARSRPRDAGRSAARQHPRAQPLLSRRRDGADDRHRARSSATRSARSTTASRRTRSPTCSRAKASARRSGPTGAASRWRRSTRVHGEHGDRRPRPARARSCTPTIASGSQRLNQEAAKAMAAGQRDRRRRSREDEAIKWLTINPAWALGLDDRIGSLEAGKNADVVLWSGDPFSVYSRAEKVWIDGALLLRPHRSGARSGAPTSSSASCRAEAADARHDARADRCLAAVAALAAAPRPARGADDRHHRRQGLSRQRAADRERHGGHRDGKIVAVGANVADAGRRARASTPPASG